MRGRRFASWHAALVAAAIAVALALAGCAGADGTTTRIPASLAPATPAATWVRGTPGAATGNDGATASTPGASAGAASTATPAPTSAAPAPTAPASPRGMPGMRGGMGMMGSPQTAPTALPSTPATATPETGATPAAPPTSAAIYQQNCAVCHGASRQGGKGPALLPADVTDTSYATRAIEYGVPGTLMPGWLANGLTPDQISALVDYLRTTP